MPVDKNRKTVASVTALQEEEFVWQHKLKGVAIADIAKLASAEFGKSISTTTAWRRLEAARHRIREFGNASAEQERDLTLERLDALTLQHTITVQRAKERIAAATEIGAWDDRAEAALDKSLGRLAAIEKQRSDLLGLAAPVKVDMAVTVEDSTAAELRRILEGEVA